MEGFGRGAGRAFLWHRPCSTDLHEPRSSDDPRVAQRGLPRERFVTKEAETLADAECLGLLFGVQSSRTHRADQAQALFAAFGSLAEIADREVQEVDWIGRLGVAKAARLGAAIELCRRLRGRPRTGRGRRSSPEEAAGYSGPSLEGKKKEVFRATRLDSQNGLLRDVQVSEGSLSASTVRPREVFRTAIPRGRGSPRSRTRRLYETSRRSRTTST